MAIGCCFVSKCGSEIDLFELLKPTELCSIIVCGSIIAVFEIDKF